MVMAARRSFSIATTESRSRSTAITSTLIMSTRSSFTRSGSTSLRMTMRSAAPAERFAMLSMEPTSLARSELCSNP